MRAAAVLLALGGCYNPSPPSGVACGDENVCPAGQKCIGGFCGGTMPELDASTIDVLLIDAPALCTMWDARHFDPCMLPAPMGDLNLDGTLSGYSFDTDKPELKGKMNTVIPVATMVMTQTAGPSVLVASVNNFTLTSDATLDINGARPLLIAVWGTANIAGDIDASADFSIAGPGGNAATSTANGCGSAPTGDAGTAGQPATGAGGGAFQGAG